MTLCRALSTRPKFGLASEENGGQSRNRTNDTRIFSPLLYQLSYLAEGGALDQTPTRPSSADTRNSLNFQRLAAAMSCDLFND